MAAARTFAWIGAALFAAALSYFLFAYFVTFGEIAASSGNGGAAAWDVGLFTAFAVHHSIFARERVRSFVTRLAGPLERSVYVWVASIMLIVVCAAWAPVPGTAWHVDGVATWGLRVVQLFGAWLTLRSAAAIDVFDLSGVRQVQQSRRPEGRRLPEPNTSTVEPNTNTVEPNTNTVAGGLQASGGPAPVEFKTTGPYGWVRHPIYSGWFLLVFAVPTMTMTRLVFAVTSCVYLLVAIPFEERSLRRTTGDAYGRYARQVRWKLIPGVFGWWLVVGR
jgi:hypothetical protein